MAILIEVYLIPKGPGSICTLYYMGGEKRIYVYFLQAIVSFAAIVLGYKILLKHLSPLTIILLHI